MGSNNRNNNQKYCLPDDYLENPNAKVLIDIKEYSEAAQLCVYLYVKELMEKNHYKKIIDIGCGDGLKLVKYFGNQSIYETIGTEIPEMCKYLKNKYPNYV